jgi:hypothetical protein
MVRAVSAAIVHTVELSSGALACRRDGGRFPRRAVEAVDRRLERCRFAVAKQKAFVETIEPASDRLNYSAHDFRRISAHYGACF